MTTAPENMVPGKAYQVRHRSEGQRYDRVSVMRFVDADGRDYIFDARPVFGTQHMPKTWVISIKEVPADTPIYCNRRVN